MDTSQTTAKPGKRPRPHTTPPSSTKHLPGLRPCHLRLQEHSSVRGPHRNYVCIEKRTDGIPPKYYCNLESANLISLTSIEIEGVYWCKFEIGEPLATNHVLEKHLSKSGIVHRTCKDSDCML